LNLYARIRATFRVASLFFVLHLIALFGVPSHVGAEASEGKHLYKHYCAVCHGLSGKGNGINADSLGDVHPTDLTSEEFDKYDDEEIYEVIEGGGAAVDISYFMPPFGGVFSEDQINSIVAYVRTLSETLGGPSSEAVRVRDLGIKDDKKCLMCHAKEDNLLRPIGPNIGHEGSKWKPEALSEFLRNPGKLRPNGFMPFTKAKMPNFFFTDQELSALVDYLMTLRDEGLEKTPLMGWDPTDPALIEEGEFLFTEEFACDGCHKRSPGGEGGIVGPELSDAMDRIQLVWLYYWLKDPQAMRPDTPMPDFNMSDDQARAVLAYMMTLNSNGTKAKAVSTRNADPGSVARGKRILEGKNCVGCHLIDSFNTQIASKSGSEASESVKVEED
jgi:mono/diheme cytochrome c family protein